MLEVLMAHLLQCLSSAAKVGYQYHIITAAKVHISNYFFITEILNNAEYCHCL